ncbi:hypothetical protein AHAS_Ahas09G0206200 [Arachis hypogaea]
MLMHHRDRRAKIENRAISYLQGKADVDPMSVARYTLVNGNKLGNLFWADGLMINDYQYFRDVQDTYTWLLKEFSDVMMNKEPSVVVTDGDDQMQQTIKEVFPSATHRHCAWHIDKNANSHIKDRYLLDAFKVSMFIESRETLLELVENLERVVKEYRNNELVAQFKSMYSKPVLTTGLDSIEQAAARVYTAEVFAERWRKDAKAYLNEEVDDGKDPKRAFALRYSSLWSGSIWMNFLAAKTEPTYRHTVGCVNGIIKDLEKRLCLVKKVSTPVKDIEDPEIVKTKGAPKLNKKFKGLKIRNCSIVGKLVTPEEHVIM